MKIVFFATSDFAIPSLVRLSENHDVLALVTKSDKPKGRHLLTRPSAIRLKAEELKMPLFCLEEIPPPIALEKLHGYTPDLFVVIAYGQILPSGILSIPKFYAIGLHASLLPKYRGASPISWAILNGESQTGVTVFKLNEKMDAGDIISQRKTEISDLDNVLTLSERLSRLGAESLSDAIVQIEKRQKKFEKQTEEEATYTPMLRKKDGVIDWKKSAVEIHNKVRAMLDWPGAFSVLNGRAIKIWLTEVVDVQAKEARKPGEIIKVAPDALFVSCGRGYIAIKELQTEGGRRMLVSDYLQGHKISSGDFFL